MNAIKSRNFVRYSVYAFSEFLDEEKAQANAIKAEEIRAALEQERARQDLKTRDPKIVSVLYLEKPAIAVCVMSDLDQGGIQYLTKRHTSPFRGLVSSNTVFRAFSSPDALFIALKRQECSAAIAKSDALQIIFSALLRDHVSVNVYKDFFDPAELSNWEQMAATDLADKQRQEAGHIAELRRRQAEQAADEQQKKILADERNRLDEAARREKLGQMRDRARSRATAVVQEFRKHLQDEMDAVRSEVSAEREHVATGKVSDRQADQLVRGRRSSSLMGNAFPNWVEDLSDRLKEGWQFADVRLEISDYGSAQWRRRSIEAISVRVEFPMMNRLIGERRTGCYVFTWINDEEFSFMRQTKAVSCEGFDRDFTIWSQENAFASQWNLLRE